MSDSEDFDTKNSDVEDTFLQEDKLFSVKKYLSSPNDLMDKVLFKSYHPISYFPEKLIPIPEMMKAHTAQLDQNNMNLIQQSAFQHHKLKKDVLGFLLGHHLPSKNINKKHLLTLKEHYEGKNIHYQRYQNREHYGTYILDTKAVIKQQLKNKIPGNQKPYSAPVTFRNKIEFNSNFECGNLFRVYQKQFNEFDLILQNDVNTKGNNQWFFFNVKNVPKGMTIKFNIVNLTKKHSLFDLGMKPYAFSMCRYEKRKVGWVREGMKISYDENEIVKRSNNKPYYCLSFQYKFSFEGDIVYFSHSLPYTLTDLNNFIGPFLKDRSLSKLIKIKDIGKTLCGHDVDIFQLTNEESRIKKKVIWIIGRQHSGEVTSSFMMEGIIAYLLSKCQKAKQLLNTYIFKIVPMVNVDGVVHGNSRAEIVGTDPNRKWSQPHKIINPIIYGLKKEIERDGQDVQMFLDLHSHSKKLGTFFYGNTLRQSKISSRKFPMMVCKNDQRFSYTSCRFSPYNNKSARYVLFESLKIPMIYTVESSFYGYQKDDHKITQYLPEDYRQMGITILQTLCEYSQLKLNSRSSVIQEEEEQIQQMREKQAEIEDNVGSDSDPSGDEYEEKQLKKMLPKLFETRKKKKKKVNPKNKKKIELQKKVEKEQIPEGIKIKKTVKQSQYRIYFSGRNSIAEVRPITTKKEEVEKKQFGIQVNLPETAILKGSITTNTILQRKNLCVFGQKVEDQMNIFGNNIGIQADLHKNFTQNRTQLHQIQRKSFKMTKRPSSKLQVKENNFLNRGDCGHTLGIPFLSGK